MSGQTGPNDAASEWLFRESTCQSPEGGQSGMWREGCCLSQGGRSRQPPKSQIGYIEEEVGGVRKEGMKSELKQNPVVF